MDSSFSKMRRFQKCNVWADSVQVLARMHAAGLLHLDLATANVMTSSEGDFDSEDFDIFLIDFGFALMPQGK